MIVYDIEPVASLDFHIVLKHHTVCCRNRFGPHLEGCLFQNTSCYFLIIYTVIQPRLMLNEHHIFSNPVLEYVVFNKLTCNPCLITV